MLSHFMGGPEWLGSPFSPIPILLNKLPKNLSKYNLNKHTHTALHQAVQHIVFLELLLHRIWELPWISFSFYTAPMLHMEKETETLGLQNNLPKLMTGGEKINWNPTAGLFDPKCYSPTPEGLPSPSYPLHLTGMSLSLYTCST